MKLLTFLKDIISPKKCYSCQKEGSFLCLDCLSKLSNFQPYCYICKQKSNNFKVHDKCKRNDIFYNKVIVLTHYKNYIISKLIKDWKYYNKKDIFEDFWKYLSYLLFENTFWDYIIISSPVYFWKKLFRWFNQSEIMAKKVSEELWIIYKNDLIKKIKNTKAQSHLENKKERLVNLNNTFKINSKYLDSIKWKKIIVVDDIISTWTTINEISKVLKNNWVKEVIWLIIASD